MQHNGYLVGSLFFGLWLLPMGCLVVRSGYFPRILGVLLIVGCFSYLVVGFGEFLTPGIDSVTSVFLVPAGVGEFAFMVWLLAKGARAPDAQAGMPAVAQVRSA
jgi:hypothetical protein